jgi:hypothetical protein
MIMQSTNRRRLRKFCLSVSDVTCVEEPASEVQPSAPTTIVAVTLITDDPLNQCANDVSAYLYRKAHDH